jgi:hypothetical protein
MATSGVLVLDVFGIRLYHDPTKTSFLSPAFDAVDKAKMARAFFMSVPVKGRKTA